MPCYHPIDAYRSISRVQGKYIVSHGKKLTVPYMAIKHPCGQCVGCRLDRSRQWAIRCLHESKLWEKNCFITLTYDDAHLPWDRSLKKEHFQNFMKKVRREFPRRQKDPDDPNDRGDPIRFYHCGEYGDKTRRPHYHAIMFNLDFDDKKLWKINRRTGEKYYTSEKLQECWWDSETKQTRGYAVIGEVTYQSAAYVARYIMKKINGKHQKEHYREYIVDIETGLFEGEYVDLLPEYTTMSRKPGIAKWFYEDFKDDIFPHDYCVYKGGKHKVPRYYDRLFEIENAEEYDEVKKRRIQHALKPSIKANNTADRLNTREFVQKEKLKRLIRPET